MEIVTEQGMVEFCKNVKGPFFIDTFPRTNFLQESEWISKNLEMIAAGKIGKNSHLQQGIVDISYVNIDHGRRVLLDETPCLYPSARVLTEHPELTGPMTGVLSNCYDPQSQRFLFHMRGTNISAPFGFQAAAAGMSVYGQHPSVTAALELYQEAGLERFRQFPRNVLAIDVLPFMKAGKIPQPLFSFGFLDDLSEFPTCYNLDDVSKFEADIKTKLKEEWEDMPHKEAYHFTVPQHQVEMIAGKLNDKKRFYGPIYESTMNFVRSLRDSKQL